MMMGSDRRWEKRHVEIGSFIVPNPFKACIRSSWDDGNRLLVETDWTARIRSYVFFSKDSILFFQKKTRWVFNMSRKLRRDWSWSMSVFLFIGKIRCCILHEAGYWTDQRGNRRMNRKICNKGNVIEKRIWTRKLKWRWTVNEASRLAYCWLWRELLESQISGLILHFWQLPWIWKEILTAKVLLCNHISTNVVFGKRSDGKPYSWGKDA